MVSPPVSRMVLKGFPLVSRAENNVSRFVKPPGTKCETFREILIPLNSICLYILYIKYIYIKKQRRIEYCKYLINKESIKWASMVSGRGNVSMGNHW